MAASIPVTVTTSRQDVYTDKAAAPFQHVFSQAILSGKKIYCSGSIGLSTETDVLVEGGIQAETERVLDNLEAVLEAAGTGLDKVIKVNVYLKDLATNFAPMNEVYVRRFAMPMPARTCVGVAGLPFNALVEIECVAWR